MEVGVLKNCIFCDLVVESANHLFLHCEASSKVWCKVFNWLEVYFITPPNLFVHLDCWTNELRSKKLRKGFWLVWHATIWTIWLEGNDRIFNNRVNEVDDIVNNIKVLSWF